MHVFSLTKLTTLLSLPCACFLWAGKCSSNWYTMWYHCHQILQILCCNPGAPHWGKHCATITTWCCMDKHCFLPDWGEIILSISFPSPSATFCLSLLLPFLQNHWVYEAMVHLLIPAGAFKEHYDTVRQCIAAWHELLMSYHLIYPSID